MAIPHPVLPSVAALAANRAACPLKGLQSSQCDLSRRTHTFGIVFVALFAVRIVYWLFFQR